MSKFLQTLTAEEKKRLSQLAASVALTGILAMAGVLLKNRYVFALQGIGLVFTVITIIRLITITKIENE